MCGREYPANHSGRIEEVGTRRSGYSWHGNQGISDNVLWKKVQREKRLLITTDKGFVHHRRESHFGILVVRLHQPNERKIHERVMGAVRQFSDEDWNGLLVVMRDVVQSSWRETY
ncbi:MAG TPA: DUF5615 family PIN-like protein [Pyrinomonadaceae bacterium]|nr:DUF5615 family PIN-like protein [Pyrinomonadaceae bacterium]